MIACEGLGKRFSNRWVFRRVSLSLESEQCLLLTGPNGSGKSTLLRVLAGLEPPSEGSVRIDIETRKELGFSATDLRLYPSLTATEHVCFAAAMRGMPQFDGVLERVGLEQSAEQPTATFSTGMRARLKLALAIMGDPKVLMLDEPGAGLDDGGRTLLENVIAEQRSRGCLILATNDPSERRFGDYELDLGG